MEMASKIMPGQVKNGKFSILNGVNIFFLDSFCIELSEL
jgi:hypothetical protein